MECSLPHALKETVYQLQMALLKNLNIYIFQVLLDVWTEAAEISKKTSGVMSAELYRGIAGSRVFVSCHVYESTAAIKQQYENPEFPAKLSEYPANIVSASQIKFGQVIPRPNLAPACEYVAIPDGSSSEARV
jgi:quinol monooxygenase YgiN